MSPLLLVLVGVTLTAAPAAAQQGTPERVVQVSGTGTVRTPPDTAMVEFTLRGEGTTPDEATRALAAKQRAVVGGLAQLLGRDAEVTTGPIAMIEVRGPGCADARGYGGQPRLSDGACAIIGHLATVQGGVRTRAIDRAGTAVGVASRLGASDARLQQFTLADPADAMRRATAAALADARSRADAIATGANVRLGSITTVRDGYSSGEIVVSASRQGPPPPPPPPPPPEMAAPIALDTRPRPIETRAQVTVIYAILP